MRNALGPSVQVFAQNIQYLIGGIIVVEYLFAYSGIGKKLVDSVGVRDVRAVQSITILLAAIYIGVNILADLAVVLLTPKLGHSSMKTPLPPDENRNRRARPRGSRRRAGSVRAVLRAALPDRDHCDTVRGPVGCGAARDGRARPRRAVAGSLGRAERPPLALLATAIAYVGGLVIGLVAGYGRGVAGRTADARRRRAALVPGAALHPGDRHEVPARARRSSWQRWQWSGAPDRQDHPGRDARAVGPRLRRGGRGAGRAAARDPPGEILPNIVSPIMADAGLRSFSIILVASVASSAWACSRRTRTGG